VPSSLSRAPITREMEEGAVSQRRAVAAKLPERTTSAKISR
jgi:hypothetical protein